MKKRILCLVLSFALVIGMAISVSAAEAEGLSGTLTISMLATNQPGMELVIADFEAANPDVTVECEFISDLGAFDTQIPTRFAAGNSTDIVHLIAGGGSATSVEEAAKAGHVLDLSDMPWASDMFEDTKDLFMYDGKVVAYDFGFCPLACLIYNKDIFEANGLTAPKTFDELVVVCDALKAAGITPIAYAGGEIFVNLNDVCVMIGAEVISQDPDWMSKLLSGETSFAETPGVRTCLEEFQTLIDNGYLSPGCEAMTQSEMVSEFASGQAAMMFTYGGHAGMVKTESPELNIGEIAWPGTTADKSRVMVQASGGMVIADTCKNVELAEAFLEFWRQPEEQAKFAEGASCISVNQIKEGKTEGNYVELTGVPFTADISARWPNTTFGAKWGASLQGMITGQRTIDDVIADADEYFRE